MKPLTLLQIAEATGGKLIGGDSSLGIPDICTDTRAMKPNSLFIALRGERFDAHDNLEQAFTSGAVAALIHDESKKPNGPAVLVDDTRRAMGRLANEIRRRFDRTRVIAVAGSNGKTGTKHLIHSVLSQRFTGSMSPKSFNNDVGVPVTLFAVNEGDDYVVVEVGTNHPGEVEHLSRMCEPDIAVITSIGEEHMAFFKTLDGVRDENVNIAAGLRPNGKIIINGDDAGLRERCHLPRGTGFQPVSAIQNHGLEAHATKTITFGFGSENDLIANDIHTTLEGTTFKCGSQFSLPAIGRHHASNALIAIAIGREFGMDDDAIREGLANASSPEMRMQKRAIGPVTIINDAYNANPTSMRAAIETLAAIDWPGRKLAVLGEMRELGDASADAHRAIADRARSASFSLLGFVGNSFAFTQQTEGVSWFPDAASAKPFVEQLSPGDLILIKASRGVRLETIEAAIAEWFA